jgi:phosphoglycolate phosphatase
MTRYRLAIFDFDGTLADSLPWFRASFQGMVERFGLAPVAADELEGLRGLTARQVMARLKVPVWQLPAIVSDMRRRKLAAASGISLFGGVPALLSDLRRLGVETAIVSSDSEASVRQVLGQTATFISHFDCGAALFGKHHKFRRVARLGLRPARRVAGGGTNAFLQFDRRAGIGVSNQFSPLMSDKTKAQSERSTTVVKHERDKIVGVVADDAAPQRA